MRWIGVILDDLFYVTLGMIHFAGLRCIAGRSAGRTSSRVISFPEMARISKWKALIPCWVTANHLAADDVVSQHAVVLNRNEDFIKRLVHRAIAICQAAVAVARLAEGAV
jgi:hypothetical protein